MQLPARLVQAPQITAASPATRPRIFGCKARLVWTVLWKATSRKVRLDDASFATTPARLVRAHYTTANLATRHRTSGYRLLHASTVRLKDTLRIA